MKDKSSEMQRLPIFAWYRLPVDIADNPIVNFIVAEMGTEGFGRFIQLSTQLISQLRTEHGPIVSELSVGRWCSLLGCKQKGLIKFLDHLKNEGHLFWEQNGNLLRIEMPKLREVFDLSIPPKKKKSDDSTIRKEKLTLENDKEIQNEENEDSHVETRTETSFSFLTDNDYDRLKTALSQSGKEAISATSAAVKSIFSRIGKNEESFSKVQSMITNQFSKNDQSRQLGDAVLTTSKSAYREGIKQHELRGFAATDKKNAEAWHLKIKQSPECTDPICKSVIHRINQAGNIYDANISFEDAEHFIRMEIDYWGEKEVRSRFQEVINFLKRSQKENENSITEEQGNYKKSTLKKRTPSPNNKKQSSVEVDSFDDDDDPSPSQFRKRTARVEDEWDYDA